MLEYWNQELVVAHYKVESPSEVISTTGRDRLPSDSMGGR
jgi:hypothetical protein